MLDSISLCSEAIDEGIRVEREKQFVESLVGQQRRMIFAYLNTQNGMIEINHVIHELEKMEEPNRNETESQKAPMSMKSYNKRRRNVREVFRKYDEDGSESIDM